MAGVFLGRTDLDGNRKRGGKSQLRSDTLIGELEVFPTDSPIYSKTQNNVLRLPTDLIRYVQA